MHPSCEEVWGTDHETKPVRLFLVPELAALFVVVVVFLVWFFLFRCGSSRKAMKVKMDAGERRAFFPPQQKASRRQQCKLRAQTHTLVVVCRVWEKKGKIK